MNTDMRSMHLTGHGELEWGEVVRLLEGLTCAWADYEGFHVEHRCPAQAPPYSHLWAWSQDSSRLLRVRIDDGKGIVGELSEIPPVDASGHHQTPEGYPKEVRVRVTSCIPWGGDQLLGRKLPEDAQKNFRRFEPVIPLSATFIGGPALGNGNPGKVSGACGSAERSKKYSTQDPVEVDSPDPYSLHR